MSVPQLPGFRYVKPLGRGGYGEVFSAYQDQFDRWVAVKVLGFTLTDPRLQRQFVRECRLAGRLSAHPNIVTVYDSGITAGGQPYITMELFADGSITDALRLQGPFPVADAVRIGIALTGALETAHGAGVVHRDVKPANVLLATYGQPALTDFGLSVVAEQHEASMAIDALTPYHAAPEVLERTAASPVADVYSLASTVYAMLAGRAPHQVTGDSPDSIAALLLRVLQQDVPPLERPDAPPSLHAALGRALARDAATRTPTARTFAAELQSVQRELGLEVTEPVVMDVPGGVDAAAPEPDRTGLVIPPPPPAPPLPPPATAAPPAPPQAENPDRPPLPARTPGAPGASRGNGAGSTEPAEPSLDQLAALERALLGQPPSTEPLAPAERTRRPPPAPLRRRPDTPAPPPAAQAAPPPGPSAADPERPPAPSDLAGAPLSPVDTPLGPPVATPDHRARPATHAAPPSAAPAAHPEPPPTPPAPPMPPAPPAPPPGPPPMPESHAAPPEPAQPAGPPGAPAPSTGATAPPSGPVEPGISMAPPGWPAEAGTGSPPVPPPATEAGPATVVAEDGGGLPSWVTEAMEARPPDAAVPPTTPPTMGPPATATEIDGDMTVERAAMRGYLPPSAPPPVTAPPAGGPVEPPRRSGRALPVVVGLLVVIAAAMGAFVLFGQGDEGGDPDDTEPPPSTTTLPPPTGLTAVESPAGVQLEWDGDDDAIYAVLMMSELTEPQVIPAETGSSMLVPATRLSPDDAYCFAVAYFDGLEAARNEDAFGPPVCIRGASEDTVRPG